MVIKARPPSDSGSDSQKIKNYLEGLESKERILQSTGFIPTDRCCHT